MADDRKKFGGSSEDTAAGILRCKGYKILERNFRTSLGEIDIVAKHKGTIVFVEVKARRSAAYGDPKWAVTPAKQRKISMVALTWLKMNGGTRTKARFDVVTVQYAPGRPSEDQPGQDRPKVEIIPNAFELAYP